MKRLLIIAIIIPVVFIFTVVVFITKYKGEVEVITNKNSYEKGEFVALKIINSSLKNVCFSSCEPYFIETEIEGRWERVEYVDCSREDIVEVCIPKKSIKAFEAEIDMFDLFGNGTYRLAIPHCNNCSENELFREDSWIYSNNFEIK